MRWYILYDNGSIVDNTCPLESLPTKGVQCIVDFSQEVRTIHNRSSYYILTDDGWIVVEEDGLKDHILNMFHIVRKVVMGRTMVNDAFWAIYDKAKTIN